MLERYVVYLKPGDLLPTAVVMEADAQATIADLQGQAKDYQACRDALDRTVLELKQAQQRVAQLEGDVEEQKRNYLNACETIYKMYVAATGREGVAPKRGVVEDLADLQADHATLLGLVQAFIEAWDHDGEPDAMSYEVAVDQAKKYLASLPAQPAQGGANG